MKPSNRPAVGLAALLGTLAGVFFLHYYIGHEDPAYPWDWGGYYRLYQDSAKLLLSGDLLWLPSIFHSILSDDYNASSIAPLFPFYAVFGDARFGYVLAVFLTYLLPTAIITTILSRQAIDRDGASSPSATIEILWIGAAALLFPAFWAPTIRGMPDIAGLVPLGLATILATRGDFLTRPLVRTAIHIGVLLWLAFLLRRWYAFATVGFVVTAVGFSTLQILRAPRPWPALMAALRAYGAMAGIIAFLLLAFQSQLVLRILTTSYADEYAAYQRPLADQFFMLYERFGNVFCLLALAGVVLALMRRNASVIFCALAAVLTFAIFSRTQAPGLHHTLPIFLWLFVAAIYPLGVLFRRLPAAARLPAALAAALWAGLSFGSVFVPEVRTATAWAAPVVPRLTIYPLKLGNLSEYRRLIAAIKALQPPTAMVAAYGSGDSFSDALLSALDRSLEPRLSWIGHVDSRDRMRLGPLRAPYAVVADPVPRHLPTGTQEVVRVPAESILGGTDLGSGYEKIDGPFVLDETHKAYIFHRKRDLSDEDISWLQAKLRQSYPAWTWNGADAIK